MFRRRFTASTFPTRKTTTNRKWDAVVVGGGHNGLTAAAYLARAGLAVLVLEELVPGFRFSRCSYLQSLLRPAIICDLDLRRHGLHLLKRNPSSFTLTLDGRYILLGRSPDLNRSEISKLSPKDAAFYPIYEQKLEKFGDLMDSLLDAPTPESRQESLVSISDRLRKFRFWAGLGRRLMRLG